MAEEGNYNATTDAHGLYNTFQFVLRLSPLVHRQLAEVTPGIQLNGDVGFERAKAFSTYLHETVHWWQHIGSTYGFMMSMSYPAQVHGNYNRLRKIIGDYGFQKPIRNIDTEGGPNGPGTPRGDANTIINNHFDFTAFRRLTFNEKLARSAVEDPYFESIGHAFFMTYANNVMILASTVDPEVKAFQHPREWEPFTQAMRAKKMEGFYYGSPVTLWGIGAQEIMEGQASFSQMQYLAFASGGNLGWDDFRAIGMLHGVYETAFQRFLKETQREWPPTVDHPTVGLFLLICDMALNPGAGFPLPIEFYPAFIDDTDPGVRFVCLSVMARRECPDVFDAIKTYSREEYEAVTERLSAVLKIHSPLAIASTCTKWIEDDGPFASLMEEYRSFDYGQVNHPIRVLFSHFLAFMEDKFKAPEFFCWPGAWMAGSRVSTRSAELFDKHGALFIDKEDNDGIFPRLIPGREEHLIQKTFDVFYQANVVYDMVDQWISEPGPFKYDFAWLKPDGAPEEVKAFIDRNFHHVFGVMPDTAKILD